MTDKPYIYISPSEVRPSAQLDHCVNHPNASASGGFGLAGGGFGSYSVCDECGQVFGKQNEPEDE